VAGFGVLERSASAELRKSDVFGTMVPRRDVVVAKGYDGIWLDAQDTAFSKGEGLLCFEVKGAGSYSSRGAEPVFAHIPSVMRKD
jgi:hypothetical protein